MNQRTRQIAIIGTGVVLLILGAALMGVGLLLMLDGPSQEEVRFGGRSTEALLNAMTRPSRELAIVGGALFVSAFLCFICGLHLEIRDLLRPD